MYRIISTITILLMFAVQAFSQNAGPGPFRLPQGCTESDYIPKTIIFRLSDQMPKGWNFSKSGDHPLDKALAAIQGKHIQNKFPRHTAPAEKYDRAGNRFADLSLICECEYDSEIPIEKAINLLLATGCLEYAQPHYISRPLAYIPSDPLNFNQYHLPLCGFYDAWDIEHGDTNIVIGIADWGTELNHPDLAGNIKYNYNDPVDGLDNDNDGYTDNYMGWDMGCNDNNPQQTGGMVHGAYVSGYASATTDNGLGVSGTGFRCKFLPVKVSDAANNGTMTYESIVYAADHGCKVINCSWGTSFYPGPYAQQIIDYAAINCDAVIVAACGNDNSRAEYYPASYNHVLSVAATNNTDAKWLGSTYGHFVDICAPGENVWTTSGGTGYDYSSGTSFSSPIVAGAAGLLRSHFPSMSALQITEQLKVTADIIDTLAANLPYAGLMGAGRLNIFRALTDATKPSLRMTNASFSDANPDGIFSPNETVTLTGDFINYLAPSGSGTTVTLTSASPYVHVISGIFAAGSIPTMGTVNNISAPFIFLVQPNVPLSEELWLKLTFSDGTFSGVQYLSVIANPDFVNVYTDKIATTITSNGFLGYNNMNSRQGLGFVYNDSPSLMFLGGFIAGVSSSRVSDVLYGSGGYVDHDFLSLQNVNKLASPVDADIETYGLFNDDQAGAGKLNIEVAHQTYAWDEPGLDRFIIMEFNIRNTGAAALSNFYAGYFVDWDINKNMENRAGYLPAERTGYVCPYNGGLYTGIKLLSPGGCYCYSFDNNGINGSINIYDDFTGNEKYVALQTNRPQAGMTGQGNDVSQMLSTGPFTIAAGDSLKVAFALLAGDYPADLQAVADAARDKYSQMLSLNEIRAGNSLNAVVYPNPFDDEFGVSISCEVGQEILISISDITGRLCYGGDFNSLAGSNYINVSAEKWPAGVYFCKISRIDDVRVIRLVKL